MIFLINKTLKYFLFFSTFYKKLSKYLINFKSIMCTLLFNYFFLLLILFKQSFILLDYSLNLLKNHVMLPEVDFFFTYNVLDYNVFIVFSIYIMLLIFFIHLLIYFFMYVQPALFVSKFYNNFVNCLIFLAIGFFFNYFFFLDYLVNYIAYLIKFQLNLKTASNVLYFDYNIYKWCRICFICLITFNFFLIFPIFFFKSLFLFNKFSKIVQNIFHFKIEIIFFFFLLFNLYIVVAKLVLFFTFYYFVLMEYFYFIILNSQLK